MLKINEIFNSLQGEGHWVGTSMIFIRLSGCNLGCSFCDTTAETFLWMTEEDILSQVKSFFPCRRICITGGEPLLQDLSVLTELLHKNGCYIHMETNGSLNYSVKFPVDWITISPKEAPLTQTLLYSAKEIKFICGMEGWLFILRRTMKLLNPSESGTGTELYLQPVHDEKGPLKYALDLALDYIKQHPNFKLSLQMHKLIGVR